MPLPVLVGTPVTAIQASGTTVTLTKPAGLANGDYLIVTCRSQASGSPTDWTCPGFTRAPGPAFVGSDATSRVQGFYYKLVTDVAGEPASYVFTVGGAASRAVGMLLVVRSAGPSSPLAGSGGIYGGVGRTNGKQVPVYTAPIPALLLFTGGNDLSSPNDHVPTVLPAGYTAVGTVVTSASLAVSRTFMWVGQVADLDGTTSTAEIAWVAAGGPYAGGMAIRGSGQPKVWNGTAWVQKPAKVWTGAAWVEKPVKVWTGTAWKTLT